MNEEVEVRLSVEQVAKRWQCSRAHVYHLVRRGELRAIRIGDLYRFRPEEIEEYEARIQEGDESSPSEADIGMDLKLSITQLAARWQCSRQHICNIVARGEIPHIKVGSLVRFTQESIQEYEDRDQKQKPAPVAQPQPPARLDAPPPASEFGASSPGFVAGMKIRKRQLEQKAAQEKKLVEQSEKQSGVKLR